MELKFYQVDVFTQNPLGGNPLAVFVDATGLDTETMQKIAREMNLSETTFVFPSSDDGADFDVRIFTPGKELLFAGHPTLGTAHILREAGKIPEKENIIRLKMGVGIIPVHVEENGNRLFMEHPRPEFLQPQSALDLVSAALGLPSSAIDHRWPCQVVSTGLPALLVPLKNLESVRNIEGNLSTLKKMFAALEIDMIYVFTLETVHNSYSVHSRLFAPFVGVPEDPATGSASGALGAYLAQHKVLDPEKLGDIKFEQGYEMGRPASIFVEVEETAGDIKSIRVGGESVTVIEGKLQIKSG